MSLLFWLLWIVNLCFIIVISYSNSLKSHHSPGLDLDKMVMIGLGIVLVGSLVVRTSLSRRRSASGSLECHLRGC